MTGHYENFSRLDGSCCEAVKVTSARAKTKKYRLKLTMLSITKEEKFFLFRSHGRVRFGSVNMTSNDLFRTQADIEKCFPFFQR